MAWFARLAAALALGFGLVAFASSLPALRAAIAVAVGLVLLGTRRWTAMPIAVAVALVAGALVGLDAPVQLVTMAAGAALVAMVLEAGQGQRFGQHDPSPEVLARLGVDHVPSDSLARLLAREIARAHRLDGVALLAVFTPTDSTVDPVRALTRLRELVRVSDTIGFDARSQEISLVATVASESATEALLSRIGHEFGDHEISMASSTPTRTTASDLLDELTSVGVGGTRRERDNW